MTKQEIYCAMFRHKWSDWLALRIDKLTRRCERCGKVETYVGPVDKCIVTKKFYPYQIKG